MWNDRRTELDVWIKIGRVSITYCAETVEIVSRPEHGSAENPEIQGKHIKTPATSQAIEGQ